MVSLIKAGAFDNMMDRKICMGWYLWETCDKKKRITLQNVPGLIKNNLLPEHTKEQQTARRIYEFNRYLKSVCKSNENYILDDRAINFITEMNYDNLFQYKDNHVFINQKSWDKIYQTWMNIFRKWISENHDEILSNLNKSIFKADWEKYALGNLSSWEMEALSFYYHDHELAHINNDRYGFANFEDLPEEPIIDRTFKRGDKTINLFKLFRICGTCIAKNKTRHIVTLLTTSGVVDVKLNKDHFAYFDKRISARGDDGVKHTVEPSWFNRGNMLVVQGIRSGDTFMAKRYASSSFHQLYHIDKVNEDGTIELRAERAQGDAEDEE
jgi:DNA polymerase-3 subunit alpha